MKNTVLAAILTVILIALPAYPQPVGAEGSASAQVGSADVKDKPAATPEVKHPTVTLKKADYEALQKAADDIGKAQTDEASAKLAYEKAAAIRVILEQRFEETRLRALMAAGTTDPDAIIAPDPNAPKK